MTEKSLSEMTLEELWQLFPIFLVEPNANWASYYAEMVAVLKHALRGCKIARMSHVGSTAIGGIWAKNIVDILLEIENDEDIERVAKIIEGAGWIRMSTTSRRISLNFGYTLQGFAEKVYHLHIHYKGDNDELYFRDYLREHLRIAKEYEQLKLELWKKYEHDRDAYTEAKSEFIKKCVVKAKKEYGKQY